MFIHANIQIYRGTFVCIMNFNSNFDVNRVLKYCGCLGNMSGSAL